MRVIGALRSRSGQWLRDYPVTIAVTSATTLTSAAAFRWPEVMHHLQRDRSALNSGHWWRLASPLLVQSFGIGQAVFNLVGCAVVGVAVERRYGGLRWLLVYVLAGIAGVLAADHWQPADHGSGSSDAVAGLVGALVVSMVVTKTLPWWPCYLYAAFFAATLTGLAASGFVLASLLAPVSSALVMSARGAGRLDLLRPGVVGLVLAGGVAMTALGDTHGVGILVGAVAAAALGGGRSEQAAVADRVGVAVP
jgi:membrane associated rhomboid family serine protease